jgi:hypothetical protein
MDFILMIAELFNHLLGYAKESSSDIYEILHNLNKISAEYAILAITVHKIKKHLNGHSDASNNK